MKTVSVRVQGDHLEGLTHARSPVAAVTELIWNGLDADASEIRVQIARNLLGGLEAVRVRDNGRGLPYDEAVPAFENLGGSWKRRATKTKGGRLLHGRLGKGRFRAFALGGQVTWTTRYRVDAKVLEYQIVGDRASLETFSIGDAAEAPAMEAGTEVEVTRLHRDFRSLVGEKAVEAVAEELALYLRQYPEVRVLWDGESVDPARVEDRVADYPLPPITLQDGRTATGVLTIIEWKVPKERALYLCSAGGFTLAEMATGIQAPGFNFTAYLKAAVLQELDDEGALLLEELHQDLNALLVVAKEQLREHFRRRAAERAADLVDTWKREDIYPYTGEPRNPVETAGRQVFDVIAFNVNAYLPDFEESNQRAKRLAFRLLRHGIETSPAAVQRIIQDVLDLPSEKQGELFDLLQKTSLEAIISAAKVVADRLDFLRGLETLVFDPVAKGQLLERRQLHRIVAEHTWLFGEEFNLTNDDESLTNVLRRHLEGFGIELAADAAPVLREDGSEGIIDLMLSRRIPTAHAEEREHLVVELKRPLVKIDDKAAAQIRSYAFAVADDERFLGTATRWSFWAVSNEIAEGVRKEARQAKRPEGLLFDDPDGRVLIWVKTWGQLIQECRGRLRFFEERLQYPSDTARSLEYLRRTHEKYLPKSLKAAPMSP